MHRQRVRSSSLTLCIKKKLIRAVSEMRRCSLRETMEADRESI